MSLIMMTRDGSSSSSSVVVEDPLPLVGHSHSHSPSLITLIIPHHHPHFPQPPSLPFYPLTFPNSFFLFPPTLPLPYLYPTLPHPTLPYLTLPYPTLLYCVVPFPARHRHTHGLYLIRLASPHLSYPISSFIHPNHHHTHTQTHTPDHNNEHENQAKCRPGRPRRASRGQRRQRGRGVSVFFFLFCFGIRLSCCRILCAIDFRVPMQSPRYLVVVERLRNIGSLAFAMLRSRRVRRGCVA